MKLLDIQKAIGAAVLLLSVPCDAKHGHGLSHLGGLRTRHNHQHKRHASPNVESIEDGLEKRGTCQFPTNAGMVSVPGASNGGWAMSPDQSCTPGNYCPYACPPGKVMAQWDKSATSYTYPLSMNGGAYCDNNGQIQKPFTDNDWCVDGTGTVSVQNSCGSGVSFCQTVLPGNEAMLIPTYVEDHAVLAVPDTTYWCETAAHYYVNPPGIGTSDACIWGSDSNPHGNWSPYVSGANTDSSGNTFVKLDWNPIFIASELAGTTPTFGLNITCPGGGCNGLPCSIDPSVNKPGTVTSSDSSTGAGGTSFCVATVPKGGKAVIVVFEVGGSGSGSGSSKSSSSSPSKAASSSSPPSSSSSPSSTPTPTPSPSSTSTSKISSTSPSSSPSSSKPSPTSTSTSLSTSSAPSTTSSTISSTTSSSILSTTSSSIIFSSSSSLILTTSSASINVTTTSFSSTSSSATASNSPHVLYQNGTATALVTPMATGNSGSSAVNKTALSTMASPTSKHNGAGSTFVSGSTLIGALLAIASTYFL
ncbi:Uncharacterized protein LSUB1_G004866 [Lachnellula subtilissima]|uniref:Secreted beta-glucosidase adg3 n=1 Tax=Lachnellula subtilissima TaxID=602034 RepID=A0A8H8RTW7_9HELO|nr:Uncharacterized protein LSUB1_G004866 [Lachnellula subtilissima]